jgi:hypothetical protein
MALSQYEIYPQLIVKRSLNPLAGSVLMSDTKDERPPSSAGGTQNNELINLNSLASLNLLHQQVSPLKSL